MGTVGDVSLPRPIALVTGAGSGVGRAMALALARQGASLCLVGRNQTALEETAAAAREHSQATSFQLDLNCEQEYQSVRKYLENVGKLDMLIHSAGVIHQAPTELARIEDFDVQYKTNVRAPFLLTQSLLPLLETARGQIVFINSSAALSANRPEIGQYAATKHALKAVADSLREEVNSKGLRVLSVYLGRTATPMQEKLHRQEGRCYHAEMLLQPEDVASVVCFALGLPRSAEITDIVLRPHQKSY